MRKIQRCILHKQVLRRFNDVILMEGLNWESMNLKGKSRRLARAVLRKLVVGVPAKIIGDVTEKMKESLEEGTAYYIALSSRYRQGLKEISIET